MNYLVHAFVTPLGDDLLLAGHVLGDYFKGRPSEEFPNALKRAIWLHRAVDSFADHHPLHAELRASLSACGRYQAILADMLTDHILASDGEFFPSEDVFNDYVKRIRNAFSSLKPYIPPQRIQHFYSICRPGWLEAYRYPDQLFLLVEGFSHRIRQPELAETFYRNVFDSAQTQKNNARKLIKETRNFVKDLLFKVF